jgi:uncharacterized protein YutE (UPF0331/DUF86 family)
VGEQHLALLRELVELIERYRDTVDRAELEHDREAWVKVKGALETAGQCAIDLALQIVAEKALGPPDTYRAAFQSLTRAEVIDPDLARELEGWAGLRNVLAHMYTAIDLDRMHRALSKTASLRAFHRIAARTLAPE